MNAHRRTTGLTAALALSLALAGCGKAAGTGIEVHAVAVAKVHQADKDALVALPAVAHDLRGAESSEENAGLHDYRLEAVLPEGLFSIPEKGRTLWVRLPIVHGNRVPATVEGVSTGHLELGLGGQVQALNGREVQVELPVRRDKVFILPFGCVLSPRGLDSYAFVVEQGRVLKVPVRVLDMAGDEAVLVAGPFTNGQRVVTEGLDNLLDGDAVRVLGEVEP